MRKTLLLLLFSIFTIGITYAQESGKQITGKLLDAQTKEPLIGATVTIKGTTKAAAVSLDGSFKIKVPADGTTTLLFSYIGYVSKEQVVSESNLGTITLDPTSASVKEVVITANSSLAIDRRTPIAATSVGKVYIEEKGAGAEFPELLKAAPGVMTSKGGGGYGDSRVSIRGFSSNNVALLINGIPVNDVEAGKIYWNDWAGLADVTASMQVQRGLGASKVAVPSLGGTINITTRSTELEEGGTVSQSIGSYNSFKTVLSYATGLTSKGWASSFLLSRSTGDGYTPGLYYTGYSYFANISKVLSPSQTLSFNFMGASQNHGQRYTFNTINTYRTSPLGIRYNSDYGYLNGELYSAEQNYYNKPLASINHNWQINETSSLSTQVYASYGTGAARYLSGTNVNLTPGNSQGVPRTGDIYSPIDFDAITKANLANADGTASRYLLNSVNDHKQYGILSSYKKKLGDIDLLAGVDGRYYEGEHYNQIQDLLGGSYIIDTRINTATGPSGNINNPNAHIGNGGRFNNDYRYEIASEGVYLQGEYVKDDLSAFLSVAGNNTSNRRVDYFNYLNSDPNQTSKWVSFLGYQAKGGANYNIDSHSNIFANIGYIQRAPLVGSVFLNKKNDLNPNAKPEKLLSYELGYGFRSSMFSANVNLYRSSYKDRAKVTSSTTPNDDGTFDAINISGINELHQGVEVDAKLRPIKDVTLSGSLSVGDFHYTSNTGPAQVTSTSGKTTTQDALLLKGLKIGEFGTANTTAQTTAALGLDVQVLPQIKIGANYNYYARYYASYDPTKITTTQQTKAGDFTNYQLPNFSTVDLNIVYRFKFAGLDAAFIGNVYNLLNTEYVADGFETSLPTTAAGYNFVARTNNLGVWYGSPRTYTTTFKINF
ncbi:Outer membrane receptor proteins, mostly Fe transport [Mucilaginibacter pineti]|uniref:Outer membrane receptor proteins, mostly Fe transport n=1 Tax=Mucilaginibacter pineti TaxID=1391627 RepID=A0A1G7BGZ8_9SPHI|nr:TonB-dependent receptor [Mucilaginibacter pineti]SDE26147.1 Outer membrane receptor proteins, mostly Fe transport [Mucilaginibacter pineti]